MSEKILFVKDFYVADSNSWRSHKCSLGKEIVAGNPPQLKTTIIMPDGERFFVCHLIQDIQQDRFVVYDDIIFVYYEENLLEPAVKKHIDRGWKERS